MSEKDVMLSFTLTGVFQKAVPGGKKDKLGKQNLNGITAWAAMGQLLPGIPAYSIRAI